MLLQYTTGVNTEYKDVEDDEYDENYEDKITRNHKEISQQKSVGMEEDLYDDDKV